MAVYFLAVYSLLLMVYSSDKDISPQGGTEQFTIEAAYRNVEVIVRQSHLHPRENEPVSINGM